jgi:hypothetical protein
VAKLRVAGAAVARFGTSGTDNRRVTADALAWYDDLRRRYRPARLRVLLIGESPPDPGSGARRFFYAPTLSHDNLFRGVAQAVYGDPVDLRNKVAVLERLRDDGFWLIDAVERPVNKTTSGARRRAIVGAVPQLIERCRELAPERGAIICHGLVYKLAAAALCQADVPVLHDEALPFPLGNWRAQFVAGMRQALGDGAA